MKMNPVFLFERQVGAQDVELLLPRRPLIIEDVIGGGESVGVVSLFVSAGGVRCTALPMC